MSMKSSTAMMADISELTDTPKTWTNCIAVNNNEDYRERGFAKTLLIGMWKHSHTWSYAVDEGKDGSRILAACSGLGDCDEKMHLYGYPYQLRMQTMMEQQKLPI